jgi:hypothetical protein
MRLLTLLAAVNGLAATAAQVLPQVLATPVAASSFRGLPRHLSFVHDVMIGMETVDG